MSAPPRGTRPAAADATAADLQPQIDQYLYGAVAAVNQVLPGMLERGSGTLLFSTGGSSVQPRGGAFASIGIAAASLRNYAMTLNVELAERGIHAAHVAISVFIGSGPGTEADTIAEHYWTAHTSATGPRSSTPSPETRSEPSGWAVHLVRAGSLPAS